MEWNGERQQQGFVRVAHRDMLMERGNLNCRSLASWLCGVFGARQGGDQSMLRKLFLLFGEKKLISVLNYKHMLNGISGYREKLWGDGVECYMFKAQN